MREAYCKSFSHFFNKKYRLIWDIKVWNFNDTLTNDAVSFEQPDPVVQTKDVVSERLVKI